MTEREEIERLRGHIGRLDEACDGLIRVNEVLDRVGVQLVGVLQTCIQRIAELEPIVCPLHGIKHPVDVSLNPENNLDLVLVGECSKYNKLLGEVLATYLTPQEIDLG